MPTGNDLNLGILPGDGRMLQLPRDARGKHLYVCGGTGTGKSKLIENLIRQDIRNWRKHRCGLLVLDPHGSLYDSLMLWLARYWEGARPVVPIDLRQDDWVVGYNVLRRREGADSAVIVNNFVQAMAHVWGESGTTRTPLFARWANNILRALYEKDQTLVEAEYLIDPTSKRIRHALTDGLPHRLLAQDWAYLNSLSPKDFEEEVSSTANRLRSFLSTQLLREIFGQKTASLDLSRAIDEGQIVLVNLATKQSRLSDEDASLFATLLLSDLWISAKDRGKGVEAKDVKPFYVYIDEFQNFITPTIAKNLDQARGFGLHLTLVNQFPRQILHSGAHGAQVFDSVIANARNKVVFATAGEENLRPLALDLFMGAMDPNRIKHELYSTKVLGYSEETKMIYGRSSSKGTSEGRHRGEASGRGAGGTQNYWGGDEIMDEPLGKSFSESSFGSNSVSYGDSESSSRTESETEVPCLIPQLGQELSHIQYTSLEEQLFQAMRALGDQQERHCVARIVGVRAPATITTPEVRKTPGSATSTKRFLAATYAKLPSAVSGSKALAELQARAEALAKATSPEITQEPITAKRRISKGT